MKLPAETEAAIVARYRAGAPMADGRGGRARGDLDRASRVQAAAACAPAGTARRQLAHGEYERTIELYAPGSASEDVGRLLGITGAAVRQRLRLAGDPGARAATRRAGSTLNGFRRRNFKRTRAPG